MQRITRGLRRGPELMVAFAIWIGCGTSCNNPSETRRGFNSPEALGRVLAIREAAETNDRTSVPLLVDRLEDEDEAVRLFAIKALDKMTGQRFGYDYAKPADQRAEAVERWRAFVRNGGHVTSDPAEIAAQAAAEGGLTQGRVER